MWRYLLILRDTYVCTKPLYFHRTSCLWKNLWLSQISCIVYFYPMLNDKKMQESIPCKMHLNFIMKHCFPQSLLMKNAYHKIATIKNLILKNWSGSYSLNSWFSILALASFGCKFFLSSKQTFPQSGTNSEISFHANTVDHFGI